VITEADLKKALDSVSSLIDKMDGEQGAKDALLVVIKRLFLLDKHDAWIAAAPAIPYSEYLKTDHWMEVRQDAFRLFGSRCAMCNSTEHLEAHHRTYLSIGCEKTCDVICLCRKCHGHFHAEHVAEGQKTKPIKEREAKAKEQKTKQKTEKKQAVPCSDLLARSICERLTGMTKQIFETHVGTRWLRHGELEVFMPTSYEAQVLNRNERKTKINMEATSILGSDVSVVFTECDVLPEEE